MAIDFDTPTMGIGMGMGMGVMGMGMVQARLYRLAQPSFTGAWAELGKMQV